MSDTYRLGPAGVGTVQITNGSAAVAGSGTDFTDYAVGDALVVILASGTHVERAIATITDATNLTVSSNFSDSESGRSFYILRQATTLFGYLPRSVPYAGGRRRTLAGTDRLRGFAGTAWILAALSVAQWTAARDFALGADTLFGECYVETRDADDTWAVWRAILNWPSAADYPREATTGYYLGVELPFILVSEVA